MTQEKSLLHGALKSANLSSEVETQEFWEKSLGKGAKSTGVRQQYFGRQRNDDGQQKRHLL